MTFICYERCTTCRKAKVWLEEKGANFTVRPIKEENPTAEEKQKYEETAAEWEALSLDGLKHYEPDVEKAIRLRMRLLPHL